MRKRMTVTFDENIYNGLLRVVGRGHISQFLEDLARPHVLDNHELNNGYKAMAKDINREKEAKEWIEGLHGDMRNEER